MVKIVGKKTHPPEPSHTGDFSEKKYNIYEQNLYSVSNAVSNTNKQDRL